ncbi:6076_t:CDS:2 [Diversispora eburnea]|uniref:6076_t:CDS:1 n=1 Tax=Diversispora eburnea TaxID=1213867 RepID=A0A9N8UZN6_9GLOM|nr:6076_t:CDS:2 [Diversispora eburnea]
MSWASNSRNDLTKSLGEFIGTAYFVFFGVGGNVALSNNIIDSDAGVALIAGPLAWGFSLLVNVWLWIQISDGLLNPAITIALMVTRNIGIFRGILYIVAEFLGALLGAYLIDIALPGSEGGATTLAEGTSIFQGLLLEAICTSLLTLSVFILAVEKTAQFTAALGIGWALFISAIAAGPYTGGSLNPARTFGPSIITGDFGTANWIYYAGPILGALLASAFWFIFKKFIKKPRHQDDDADPLSTGKY